jgi:ABC-type uncharacterized transport system, ATPase component
MTLKIDKVRKSFGDKIAVDNLNMVVKPGEVMGLIGQNGAGKTTTFRMILNFISADQGKITWRRWTDYARNQAKNWFLTRRTWSLSKDDS